MWHSKPKSSGPSHTVQQVLEPEEGEADEYPLLDMSSKKAAKDNVKVSENCPVEMETNTVAVLSLVSEVTRRLVQTGPWSLPM